MAFTYSDALTADRDKLRLNIGDTVSGSGPRPDKRNFTDNEITYILSVESSVAGATARAFEILAGEWLSYSIREREGEVEYDAKELADKYAEHAVRWREIASSGVSGGLQAGVIDLDFMEKDYT